MTKKTVLILDDGRDFADSLAMRCKSIGVNVRRARNALTASEVVSESPSDTICVDVTMPTGNGLRLYETLRKDRATSGIPAIILTGHNDAATIAKCLELQAHYVHKSGDVWSKLQPLIRNFIDNAPLSGERTKHVVSSAT